MLIIVLICSVFVYVFIQHSQQTLDLYIDTQVRSVRAIVKNLETEKGRHYRKRITSFINYKLEPSKEKILQAFAAQDREELLRLSTPYLNLLQSEDPAFATFAWITPDNKNLLRVHKPKTAIDDISNLRLDVVKANRDQKQNSGYNTGLRGLRYAVVEPVMYKGKHLGALQFGLDEIFALKMLTEQLHLTVGLVIPNKNFAQFTRATLPNLTGKNHTIQALNIAFFEKDREFIDWSLEQQQVILHDKEYIIVKALDLPDYAGHSQGHIFAALDISAQIADAKAKILFVIILGAALFLSSFVILYFSYGALLENIIALNRSLLKKTEEWEETFDAMNDFVTIHDKNMRIIRANKLAKSLSPEEPESIIGKKCFEVFLGLSKPCPGCPGFETFQDSQNHANIIKHEKLGKIFHVSSAPIFDEKGEIQYLIHTARDITEQKRLEEELFQAQKMEAIGTLAGGVAHDFNNILSGISGYSELARLDVPADGKASKYIDQVLQACQRATILVKQVLTFSRKSDRQLEPLAPGLIVKEALTMLRSSLPTSINIKEDIDNECGTIMADSTSIHQIVVNLCTNSVHAMKDEKGILNVRLYRKEISVEESKEEHGVSPGSFIVLEVSDTGHGMDQATISRIFEPYFTTKKVGKGTGLGLSVIHGIIHNYHGFIRVQSKLDKGTTFHVYLPALPEETSTAGKEEANKPLPTGSEHILMVDDEKMIININKTMLEQLGYKVSDTTESLEALEKFRLAPDMFDLIITDQTMPKLTGIELAQEIMAIKPTMPIIICSGYSSVMSEKDALKLGIKKYARKPIDRATLAEMVRKTLDEN